MTPLIILDAVNVFFAGLLAGMEFVIHYGVPTPAALDERARLIVRQALVLRLRVLVPAFFVPTLLTGLAVAVFNGDAAGMWFRWLGLLALLPWIGLRVIGTVPINSATLTWQPDAPPPDWQARIAHAERFHDVGVWAVVLAFAFFLASLALMLHAAS